MKSNYILVLLCFFVFTTGCDGTMPTKGFTEPANKNSFYIYGDKIGTDGERKAIESIFNDYGITTATLESDICPKKDYKPSRPGATAAPALVPLLATLGQYIFDRVQISRAEKTKALKKASSATYSGQAFLPAGNLKSARCLIMVRHEGEKPSGENSKAIIIAKLEHMKKDDPSVFNIVPTYIKAENSLAITKDLTDHKSDKNSKSKKDAAHSKINVTIAVSLKSVEKDIDSQFERISVLGASSVTIPNVELGGAAKELCKKDISCIQSELIPHRSKDSHYVSVTMAITETGQTGIDFDQQEAEINALKAAFGPAIKEALQAELPKN